MLSSLHPPASVGTVVCADIVRDRDRDRYLATLLAPETLRGHLFALYAFDLELRAVATRVSEPIIGEMRLQWWLDAFALAAHGGVSGNPVVDAVCGAVEIGNLSYESLREAINARRFDVDGRPFLSENDLKTYLDQTFGTIMRCACSILLRGRDWKDIDIIERAGYISGLIRILLTLRGCDLNGRICLSQDMLTRRSIDSNDDFPGQDEAGLVSLVHDMTSRVEKGLDELNDALPALDPALLPVFAPLATGRLWLKTLRGQSDDDMSGRVSAAPSHLRRQWRIWRFMHNRRL